MNDDEKNEFRKLLHTLPEQVPKLDMNEINSFIENEEKWKKNEFGIKIGPFQFYEGVKGLTVEMIDFPKNPYMLLYEFAVATWGNEEYPSMWSKTKPEHRFVVVKNVLEGKALPLGKEALQFSFIIRKASRASFDQHARQRIGATFASQGVRDNSRLLAGFRVPNEIWKNEEKLKKVIKMNLLLKKIYYELISSEKNNNSFQAARCMMTMNWTHNYKYTVNYMALGSYMAQRLVASEQEDTVATAIGIWNQINKKFPLLANFLRPKCDWAGKCKCHQGDGGELFGALFKGCGRFPETEGKYATFNWACTDYNTLEKQSMIHLPNPDEWKTYNTLKDLTEEDQKLFEE